MKTLPIDTAPRDGTEILLVSVQYPNEHDPSVPLEYRLISIHNGYWDGEWKLGQPHYDLRIGDACATHWLPKSAIDV